MAGKGHRRIRMWTAREARSRFGAALITPRRAQHFYLPAARTLVPSLQQSACQSTVGMFRTPPVPLPFAVTWNVGSLRAGACFAYHPCRLPFGILAFVQTLDCLPLRPLPTQHCDLL